QGVDDRPGPAGAAVLAAVRAAVAVAGGGAGGAGAGGLGGDGDGAHAFPLWLIRVFFVVGLVSLVEMRRVMAKLIRPMRMISRNSSQATAEARPRECWSPQARS